MCGRFTLATTTADELRQRWPLGESVEIEQRFNVAPGDQVVTIGVREGVQTGRLLRWGLVPPWARDPSIGYRMINARAETVAEKPAFRTSFARRRCLIVADGFYEWQRQGRAKQPFHITRADGRPFAFAGLWTGWKDPAIEDEDRAWLRTCTIVTTEANDKIHGIHPRMPVMLEPDEEQVWLDPERPQDELLRLLHPLPVEETSFRAVSRAVNNARYDGPDCLADAEPQDLKAFAEAVNAAHAEQEGLF
ncbi:SOS response-associated peptidase [Conexibacter sp. JD483]|uniref:SOS response-associated peptidase n=1 Tax=unclassified Conexibacter TaxID=2627773 RepID=UPI002726E22C|nr:MULTISPECIES: SOS response-associated peptidase [unclassified Conexibacter]MDO8185331.1 SOS response-associated peptidase [Conexibacter sp. CPCC 205706]MDO8198493.1 SOS response-associated peptidase [Conexibacter sp. CPCC 205762]MDR9368742.1 SOS response-associated peptidase [Conexibacter sp. JD483]